MQLCSWRDVLCVFLILEAKILKEINIFCITMAEVFAAKS